MNAFMWTLVFCGMAGLIKAKSPPAAGRTTANAAAAGGGGDEKEDEEAIRDRVKRFGFPIPLPQFNAQSPSGGNMWNWDYGSSKDNYYSDDDDYDYYDEYGYYYDGYGYDDDDQSGDYAYNYDDTYYNYNHDNIADPSIADPTEEQARKIRDAENVNDNSTPEGGADNKQEAGTTGEVINGEDNDVKARHKRLGFPIPLPSFEQNIQPTLLPWPTQPPRRRERYGPRGRYDSSRERRPNRRRCRKNPERKRCRKNRRGRKRKESRGGRS